MLDVSQCVDLKGLYCNNNNLTTLDVTKCTELSKLNCSNNKLTTLDIRQCSKLDGLYCDENNYYSVCDNNTELSNETNNKQG